eukprot:EC837909.1.p4 GENE.EC837909.1~~EC837909.1.p4  ORF type:complete len:71 (+),score=1.25 EC837909.1:59-271(+)
MRRVPPPPPVLKQMSSHNAKRSGIRMKTPPSSMLLVLGFMHLRKNLQEIATIMKTFLGAVQQVSGIARPN